MKSLKSVIKHIVINTIQNGWYIGYGSKLLTFPIISLI